MRVIIDAMGGNHGSDKTLKRTCSAAGKYDAEITLVGNEDELLRCAK